MEAVLIGARLLEFSGALVLFGAPLFYLYGMAPRAGEAPQAHQAHHAAWQGALLFAAAVLTWVGTVAWVMAETASFSENWRDAFDPSSLWTVLWDTRFGRACLVRTALLAASIAMGFALQRARLLWITQLILGASVVATFAWTGHGATGAGAAGSTHLIADLLHLWAAGIWVGALLPLCVMLCRASTASTAALRGIARALGRFSSIGIGVVAVLVSSGAINSWFLIGPGRWSALLTSSYGRTLMIKLGLFGAMLLLAAFNRLRLAPDLSAAVDTRTAATLALAKLRVTLLSETLLAVLVILAISLLGTLAPPVSDD